MPMTPEQKLCPTGVEGLDTVLCGGLPRDRLYLVGGIPGVGKTTLAMKFLLDGVARGEKGLYVTLSETRDELVGVAESHGWSLESLDIFELSAVEQNLKEQSENTFFHPSEVELSKISELLVKEITRVKPRRVVFDSLSEMRLMAESPLRFRRQILSLKQFFAGGQATVLLLDDFSTSGPDLQVDSLAHGVVELCRSAPDYGVVRRTLSVTKMRGVKYREGYHDFIIEKGGLRIFPRLVASEHHTAFKSEPFPSGLPGVDALLGGGLDRGTSSILMGPPGAGKSTLATQFAYAAAKRGERVDAYVFDETLGILMARSAGLGMDLSEFFRKGLIRIQQIDPAEISPGELTHRVRAGVEGGTRMVIIDSINGYLNAMPEARCLHLQLHELLAFLNQQGIVTILVLAQQGIVGPMQSVVDLTYLADTVILHRFFETAGEMRQAISVVKKRSGSHERTIREFRVDRHGIYVGEPLRDFHGILSGIPRMMPQAKNESVS